MRFRPNRITLYIIYIVTVCQYINEKYWFQHLLGINIFT